MRSDIDSAEAGGLRTSLDPNGGGNSREGLSSTVRGEPQWAGRHTKLVGLEGGKNAG